LIVIVATLFGAVAPSEAMVQVTVVDPEHEPELAVAEDSVSPLFNTSVTVTLLAVAGPLFVIAIVYMTSSDAGTEFGEAVFTMDRSATGVTASLTVDELLPGSGSFAPEGGATVAVFESVPVISPDRVAVIVKVAVPLTGRSTVVPTLPAPFAAPHCPPADATQLQEAFVSAAGKLSVTGAPITALGPLLVTTIRYETLDPGTT
jgi:hypothetical protein